MVIVALALMLFPPRELPKLLRSIAKVWGSIRATADEFREAIMQADGVDELQSLVKGTKEEIRRAEANARKELMKARADMRKAQQKLAQAARAEEVRRKEQDPAGTAGAQAAGATVQSTTPLNGPEPTSDPARPIVAPPRTPSAPADGQAPAAPQGLLPPPPPMTAAPHKVEEGAA